MPAFPVYRSRVAFLMISLISLGLTTQSVAQQPQRFSTTPSDAIAFVGLDLASVRDNKDFEFLPWEVFSVALSEQMGVDLLQADSIDVAVGMPIPVPSIGATIRTKKAIDIADLKIPQLGPIEQSPKNAKVKSRMLPGELPLRIAQQEGMTVFVGTDGMVGRMMTGSSSSSRALELAKSATDPVVVVLSIEAIRPFILQFMQSPQAQQLPPDIMRPLTSIVQLTKVLRATTSVGSTATIKIDLVANSAEDAAKLDKACTELREAGIALAEMQLGVAMEDAPEDLSPAMKQAINNYAERMKQVARRSAWTVEGDSLKMEMQGNSSVATIGVLTGLLLPAVQAARDAARRMSSSNNLKQFALAMHNYHSTYNKFPPRAIVDAEGNPLLSWRVAILPFLDQQQLYNQFHLDEPWDSAHNLTLIDKMPAVFSNPRTQSLPGMTGYVMPYGEGLPGSEEKLKIVNILDGTSNTIALVEVDSDYDVTWTAPEDFDCDEFSLEEAFILKGNGSNVAFYDGSVRFLSSFIDEEILQNLLTHAGGEPINGF